MPLALSDLSSLPLGVAHDDAHRSSKPSSIFQLTGSVASLNFSLSWQCVLSTRLTQKLTVLTRPFQYKGDFFSDETVCIVDNLLPSTNDVEASLYLDEFVATLDHNALELWPEEIPTSKTSWLEWTEDQILLSRRELSQGISEGAKSSVQTNGNVTKGTEVLSFYGLLNQ